MKLRSLALCTAAALSLGALAGCSSTKSTGASSGGGGGSAPVVGVDYPRSDTDFWNSFIQYTPQFGSKLGLELKTTNSQNDVAKLAANVQTMIARASRAW